MQGEIKICGLKTPETLEAALSAGADLVGMVFFPRSPRHIEPFAARDLIAHARGRALTTVLLVDPSDAEAAAAAALGFDLIQLHGRESPERVAAIRALTGLPVMKAVGIATVEDVVRARDYLGAANRLLLDAKAPPGAAHPGGNGLAFDWRLVAGLDLGKPFMLSGGLDPDNVGAALRLTRAPGIDVSSGVESAPGVKDPARIVAFVQAAREAFRHLSTHDAGAAAPAEEKSLLP